MHLPLPRTKQHHPKTPDYRLIFENRINFKNMNHPHHMTADLDKENIDLVNMQYIHYNSLSKHHMEQYVKSTNSERLLE